MQQSQPLLSSFDTFDSAFEHNLKRAQHAHAPYVAASAVALPQYKYEQAELAALTSRLLPAGSVSEAAVSRLFERVGVRDRHLALPAEEYESLRGFGAKSRAWIEVALPLGARALSAGLVEAGLEPSDVDMLMTTTVTGVAVPSLDARLVNVLSLRPDVKRIPLFGLGCLGGAAGLARASEYLLAFPEHCAVLLSVELCSLTFQRDDVSAANLISVGLFGDGAAAVVLLGSRHPSAAKLRRGARSVHAPQNVGHPRIVASRSAFFPNTERVMGWDMVDDGFKVVLSPEVPTVVGQHVPTAVDVFLAEHRLVRRDIATWVMHPGGPKVIDALEQSLDLPAEALQATRESLARYGNMSSASVLFLLDEYRRTRAPRAGSYGLLAAMGPGFCAELVLLQW